MTERGFLQSYKLYKPRKTGGGAASTWQLSLSPTGQGDAKRDGAVFVEFAQQVGAMKEGESAQFDWKNKLRIKLGLPDLGEIIAVLERRQKAIGPQQDGRFRGLFHKNATGSATLAFEEGQNGGWFVRIGVQKTGERPRVLSHLISNGEGSTLLVLLRLAVERILGW